MLNSILMFVFGFVVCFLIVSISENKKTRLLIRKNPYLRLFMFILTFPIFLMMFLIEIKTYKKIISSSK